MIPTTSPNALDRIMLYLRQLVRAELPRLAFFGIYEYAVQSVLSGGTAYAVTPTDTTLPLPGSNNVPLRLSCATATLTQGSLVLLMFVNGDPSRPCIVGGAPSPTNQTIDATTTLKLGPSATAIQLAGGGAAVGRVGDAIALAGAGPGQIQGTVSGGVCTITAAQFAAGQPQISAGSPKVTSG